MRKVDGYELQVERVGCPSFPQSVERESRVFSQGTGFRLTTCRNDSLKGIFGSIIMHLALFCLIMVSLSNHAFAFKLPDTGQTKCYNSAGTEIPCAGTGQDGAYNINPMSFTDNGNGTVTDNNTSLMWQKQDDGNTYNWYKASGTYDARWNPSSQDVCGELTTGSYTDWRLPTKKELITIVDYAIPGPGPTINATYFPNTKSSEYWSSTTSTDYTSNAWDVGFFDGGVYYHKSHDPYYVRCVRGGQYPAQSFTDNGNETVTDNKTGLVWQQGDPGYMTWDSALSYCEGLSLGNNTDWRLPNIKELESITDDTRDYPAIDTTFFPGAIESYYWSSTTSAGYPVYAWFVDFGSGLVGYYYKYYDSYVRCVRGGQSGLFDYYCDDDNDGHISSSISGSCSGTGCQPAGCQTSPGDDCDDTNASTNSGATEICDGVDNDCDGQVDEGLLNTYYQDADGDGYGYDDGMSSIEACTQPSGYVANNTDCDDSDAKEHPGQTWYKDADNDGYSDGTTIVQCARPAGYKIASELTATSSDCNDSNAAINPGATEISFNGIDDDCNPSTSDTTPVDLYISSLTVPSTAVAGQAIVVSDVTNNSGPGNVGVSTTKFYFSKNTRYDTKDVYLGSRSLPTLLSGASSSGSTSVTIPFGTRAGNYYIIAVADADRVIVESNERNNNRAKSITITSP